MEREVSQWYSLDWFATDTLKGLEFQHPKFLYLLVLIPLFLLLRWFIGRYNRQKLPVAFPKGSPSLNLIVLLRFVPALLIAFCSALLIVALARPQKTNEYIEQWNEGINIVIALDISESMRIEDFSPNRLEAAKNVAIDFVAGRLQDRIGMVVFSGDAFSLAPLTSDYDLLFELIKSINFEMIESRGTAIGSALAVAVNRLREEQQDQETDAEQASKVLVLISDGDNTAGNIDPIMAAKLAQAYNIKIYTILVGKTGRVPFGKDFFGNTRYVDNSVDETTMRTIAQIGEGEFFRASNVEALHQVFGLIDQYEKAKIKETRYTETTDFYTVYLSWAIVFYLLWMFSKSTFISNVLVD